MNTRPNNQRADKPTNGSECNAHRESRRRSQRYRQSRKRSEVLWTIVSLLALNLGFAAALQTNLITLTGGTSFAAKSSKLQTQLESADDPYVVVALGSSRVMNGLDAGSLEDSISQSVGRRAVVYNFGISGCGNIYSFLSLEKLIANGVKPDCVLVEMYPTFLQPGVEQPWFAANELRSKSFENTQRYGIENVTRPWHETWLTSFYTHRVSLVNQFCPKLLPMNLRENWAQESDDHGWIAVDKPLQVEKMKKQTEGFAQTAKNFRVGGDSCRALEDIVRLCRDNEIACTLCWLPECDSIRKEYSPQMESEVDTFLAQLQNEFGVPIVNAREWVDDAGFYDSAHLNRAGAQQFTKQLLNELPTHNFDVTARSSRESNSIKR